LRRGIGLCTRSTSQGPGEVGSRPADLVDSYRPIAERIARGIYSRYPRVLDVDDLVGAAYLGLVDAAQRFDPERGVPFYGFAVGRVRGAVLDALRGADWVPAHARRKRSRIEYASRRFAARMGRAPTRVELAQALDVSLAEADRLLLGAHAGAITPLKDDEDGLSWQERVPSAEPTPDDLLDVADSVEALHRAIARLPERERRVLCRYHLQEAPLKVVAAELGVTQSRICQLARQGILRLREELVTHD